MAQRILHVDKNSERLLNHREILKRAGFEVKSAATFEQADQFLRHEVFDIEIWAAEIMQGQIDDNVVIAVERKKRNPDLKVLVVSGGKEAKKLALDAGIVYLSNAEDKKLVSEVARLTRKN